jgi:hypothetical protein
LHLPGGWIQIDGVTARTVVSIQLKE